MRADKQKGDRSANQYNSHLFTIRVWQEAISQAEAEWRGRLQHVESGQVYYFRTWDTLVQHIVSTLPGGSDATSQVAQDRGADGGSAPAQSE